MALDYVMILNMEHNIERYWASMGALDTLGFDLYGGVAIRHINHNGLHYKDTKSVHEAAIADGFGEFESFRSRNRQNAAWVWSYRCALRKIVEIDKTVLVLIDDVVPSWTWKRLDALVREIEGKGGFRIIQLAAGCDPILELSERRAITSVLREGLHGYSDYAVILNAEGALFALSIYKEDLLDHHPCILYYRIRLLGEEDTEARRGMYHTSEVSCRALCEYYFQSELDNTACEPWEIELNNE